MRAVLASLIMLFAASPAIKAQTCPLGSLGSMVTALEDEIKQCGELRKQTDAMATRLERLEWRMDQIVTDHASFDTLLAAFRAEIESQVVPVQQQEVAQQSDWPVILGVAALILGASALYVALNHHHEVEHASDDVTGRTTVIVIPKPTGVCWPPGHCKHGRSGK